jgi:hypothetical protein
MSTDQTKKAAVGLDIGTMNIVSARMNAQDRVETVRIRDAFIDLDLEAKKTLRLSKIDYVEKDGRLVVIGDSALNMVNLFKRELRRPLSRGVISAGEIEAQQILSLLIKHVLGEPIVLGEHCYYSVPAVPIDDPEQDVIYHTEVFKKIVTEHGYTAHAANEAMAIIYSQCSQENFSGLSVSFGCLTPDTPIITREGWVPISEVREGHEVLTRTGQYGRVQKTWTRPHTGEVYKFSFYGNPVGVTLTGNHRVWVQRDGEWDWVPAEQLKGGDIIGEPVVSGYGERKSLCITDKDRNGPSRSVVLSWSMDLGRFLGYFLTDGHVGPKDPENGYYMVAVDFGPGEDRYVEDFKEIVERIFHRTVTVSPHGNAQRCHFSHKGLQDWLRANCYEERFGPDKIERKVKRFPLNIEEMQPSVVEGVVVGMVRGDGWVTDDAVKFGNSSQALVTAFHLLVGRMGLTSTITTREPRDATFKDGRIIHKEDCQPEWTTHITGWDGKYLKEIIEDFGRERRSVKVWKDGGFRCTRIRQVEVLPYDGVVHDLTIEGDPSFCAPYITLHNSGMCNVALAFQTVCGLSFSVARGGDWIDTHAAKAMGSTSARMCSIKEKGVNLASPANRDEEAIALYIRALIKYCLENIAIQFKKVQSSIDLPEPIPFVVSGGTTKAGGFLDVFKEEFEAIKKKNFPIQISEIRPAKDPMTAVAEGLLVLASQEDEAN